MRTGSPILLSLAGLAYLATLALLVDLRSSDAAGNGLTKAAATLALAIEWGLLAGLAAREQAAAGVALAATGALAGFLALALLEDGLHPSRWPLVLAAAGPLLVAVSAVRGPRAPAVVALAALAGVGLGTAAYRAAHRARDRAAREAEGARVEEAAFAALGPGSPVEAWLAHTARGGPRRSAALAGIRRSPGRQLELEALLGRGRSDVVRDLPEFALQPTEGLCAAARGALRAPIAETGPRAGDGPAYLAEGLTIQEYRGGLRWLVEAGCDCHEELETLARAVARCEDTPVRREFEAFLAELRAAAAR